MKRFLPAFEISLLTLPAILMIPAARVTADHRGPQGTFDLVEATIPSIQDAIDHDIISARQLVEMYLKRIAAYDGKATATHLNSYIFVNPSALRDADQGD